MRRSYPNPGIRSPLLPTQPTLQGQINRNKRQRKYEAIRRSYLKAHAGHGSHSYRAPGGGLSQTPGDRNPA